MTAGNQFVDLNDQITNIAVKKAVANMRQSGEWGMRAIPKSFPGKRQNDLQREWR